MAFAKEVGDWLDAFGTPSAQCLAALQSVYGSRDELVSQRLGRYLRLLETFAELHGPDRETILVRCPGRLNLLGRHVDHRGGYNNSIALNREVLLVAAPRDDDRVTMQNVEPEQFPARTFSISEEAARVDISDWVGFINSDAVTSAVAESAGDWSNYAKGAILKTQSVFPKKPLRGADIVAYGDVPRGAGLSSSSALTVAVAEAITLLNDIDLSPEQFIDVCGEGEWYVGTRGGSGDHAAMKLCREGMLLRMRFLPFKVVEHVPFPPGYTVVVCNSLETSQKAGQSKNVFNNRVAAYEFGLMLLHNTFPEVAETVRHLRDLSLDTRGLDLETIYKMIRSLPARISRADLTKVLPEHADTLGVIFSTHDEPAEGYAVRDVCLYGVAECQRSKEAGERLKAGDVAAFGQLMTTSHDGDRVVRFDETGAVHPFRATATDEYLDGLIEQPAPLSAQPGAYSCSTEKLDFLVDEALRVDGVVGAQMAGAGLGGCIMALVEDSSVQPLMSRLETRYRDRYGVDISNAIEPCVPIRGSGPITSRT